jgi:hypothetical protein
MFFNGNVIEMINSKEQYFTKDEHLFIVAYDDIYEKYKNDNVILIKGITGKNLKLFKKYAKMASYVFMHSNDFMHIKRMILTPKSIKKKYIWCVWGGDLYTDFLKITTVKEFAFYLIYRVGAFLINREAKYYKGIGIGFRYDALEIRRRFHRRNIKIVTTPYLSDVKLNDVNKIINACKEKTVNENPLKVMVAHSAHSYLNHKEILDKLSKYKDEDMIISLVLAYGNKRYASDVEQHARKLFGDKVEIIKDRTDSNEYIKYLHSVDIAVFDHKHQSALGNLYYLLYMGKKVYLNSDGILKLAMRLEDINTFDTHQIGIESFEHFSSLDFNRNNGQVFAEFYMDENNTYKMWNRTLNDL